MLAAFFLALAVHAGAPVDPELQRLTANLQNAKTQTEMNLASEKLAQFWNARLTAIEAKIEGRLSIRERNRFADSKERWRSYRATEVSLRAGLYEDGSMRPLLLNAAYTQITEHRVSELESLFRDALAGRGEPGGPASGSQPIRSETNSTSSAAGSRR